MHHYILVMDNEDTVFSIRYRGNQESTPGFKKLSANLLIFIVEKIYYLYRYKFGRVFNLSTVP